MAKRNIVIFGVGKKLAWAEKKYPELFENLNIVAYLDNNQERWEEKRNGAQIVSPAAVRDLCFDVVILMADYIHDMKKQLLDLGVPADKIFIWSQFFCMDRHGVFKDYKIGGIVHTKEEKILLISVNLNYNGGTVAIINAAKALTMRGYDVTVAAPDANDKLLDEAKRQKVHIVLAPAIGYPQQEEMDWIEQFDVVIVNVFQMIRCACIVSQRKPVIWWVHESSGKYDNIYSITRDNHAEFDTLDAMGNINIVAVSDKARNNFNAFYPARIKEILPYGIPDTCESGEDKKNGKVIMAIVGILHPIKAQMVFLDAVSRLSIQEQKNAEFWMIGEIPQTPYAEEVCKRAEDISAVKLLGELTQEQMREKYREIDVVICASLEETMSLPITEGMMHGKVCITTDATGMAAFIQDEVNGLVCAVNSAESLYRKMKWVLAHPDRQSEIGKHARKTYEENFTMEKFGIRLQTLIENML